VARRAKNEHEEFVAYARERNWSVELYDYLGGPDDAIARKAPVEELTVAGQDEYVYWRWVKGGKIIYASDRKGAFNGPNLLKQMKGTIDGHA